MSVTRKFIGVAAAGAVFLLASAANASVTITVPKNPFDTGSSTGEIKYSPTNTDYKNLPIGRFKFTGTDSNGITTSYLSYCIDLFQGLASGVYDVVPLSSYSTYLTPQKQAQLSALISHTDGLSQDGEHSAAVQLAVWEIAYEYNTLSSYSYDTGYFTALGDGLANAKSDANGYLSKVLDGSWAADNNYSFSVLKSDSYQDQLVWSRATAAVPEPASWAMLVMGFGLVGGALRRARVNRVAFV